MHSLKNSNGQKCKAGNDTPKLFRAAAAKTAAFNSAKKMTNRHGPKPIRQTVGEAGHLFYVTFTQPMHTHIHSKKHHCVRSSCPSKKMGQILQFESHRCELPAILNFEHDPKILELFAQPSPCNANSQRGNS